MSGDEKQRASQPMVGWYDPLQLLDTARRMLAAELVSDHVDPRLLFALIAADAGPHRIAATREGPFMVDFVADTGDGHTSTFAVARALASDHTHGSTLLRRGDVVLFGGDLVYPVGSHDGYRDRFVSPYTRAFADGSVTPAFAIPGNHDWYDGLIAFRQLLLGGDARVGVLSFEQRRSYYALSLPYGVWVFGFDFGFHGDIDELQAATFERVLATLPDDARVIVCVPDPFWVNDVEALCAGDEEQTIDEFMDAARPRFRGTMRKLGARAKLFLTGDLHHYKRHERDGVDYVTAGGGGAFLHSTHGWRDGEFRNTKSYPDEETSRDLGRDLWWKFVVRNKAFGLASAFLYGLLYITLAPPFVPARGKPLGDILLYALRGTWTQPIGMLIIVSLVVGFIYFTDTRKPEFRYPAAILHALSHLVCAVLPSIVFALLLPALSDDPTLSGIGLELLLFAIQLAWGAFAGSLVMGLYLHVSLRFFQRHRNEAFTALKTEDFKNFLRIEIDQASIVVHAMGIDDVGAPVVKVVDTFAIPRAD